MSALTDQFDVLDDDVDLNELLSAVAHRAERGIFSNSKPTPKTSNLLELEELATRWDEHQHPRWPKGAQDPATGKSKAGQFMETGQQFMHDGKRYEISFFGPKGSGKVFAVLAGGPKNVGTQEFDVAQTGGGDSGSQPTIKGASPAEAKSFVAGTGTSGLTGLTVSPFVEDDHDPTLALPTGIPGMKVSPAAWKRFGRADQMNFIRLAQEFGTYSAGQNAALIAKLKGQVDSTALNDVVSAFQGQHGSSSGTRFNFAGFVNGITDKLKLTSAQGRREKARQALAEVAAVIQWDLYNRCNAPDVTVFHRDNNGHAPGWWKQHFIDGDQPVMSGLSQSWRYGVWSGDTMLVTPLAIRHVCMSAYSVQPAEALGSHEGYKNEKEVSTPDQLLLDSRAVVLSENLQLKGTGIKEWLASETSHPRGGEIAIAVREYIQSGKIPPLPPPKPNIQMQGSGAKLWVSPSPDIGKEVLTDFHGKPFPEPKLVAQLGYLNEQPMAANSLDLKAGDLIEGLQGSRYVILDDPGNQEGFPYVRAEIGPDGTWLGPNKTFSFSGGGDKPFRKLNGHINVPKPQMQEDTGPLWDPDAWANGTTDVETAKLPVGTIFKVNEIPYQITGQAGGQISIKDLNTGKVGSINGDYQANAMVPKEGYVAVDTSHETKVEVGVTFAYQGEKYVVTKQLKGTGQWQAKRATGSGVIKLNPDDSALSASNLHDPAAWDISDDESAIGSLPPGAKFHGGTGQLTQKPYVVTKQEDGKTFARNLDTGAEVSLSAKKKYRLLVPKAAPTDSNAPGNPDQHIPQNWKINAEGAPLPDGYQPVGALGRARSSWWRTMRGSRSRSFTTRRPETWFRARARS
jgi:hypothetical protein